MAKQKYRYVTGMGGIPVAIPIEGKSSSKPPPPSFDFRKSAGSLGRAQQQAQVKVDRAKRALPAQPVPYVPIVQHPTKPQRAAAREILTHAQSQAVRGTTGAGRLSAIDAYQHQVATDPRMGRVKGAQAFYGKIEANNRLIREAVVAGAGGTRAQRIAAGHALVENHAARDYVKAAPKESPLHKGLATILAQTSLGGASAENQFVKNALGDVIGFPQGAIQGAYFTAQAGVDLAHGRTTGAQQILSSLQHSALGELATGHPVKAGEAFVNHPLYSVLDFTALGSVAGRAAGLAARSGVLGAAAKAGAQTARADLELIPGSRQVVSQSYSRNPALKVAQQALEKAKPSPKQIDRELGRNANEFTAVTEGLRRRGREEVTRAAKDLRPSSKSAQNVVLAAVEGRLRGPATFAKDLTHERDRLNDVYKAERSTMSTRAARDNREQVKALEAALKNPDAIKDQVFAAADQYHGIAGDFEKQLIDRKALNSDQAAASKLRPYAVSHMGARFDESKAAVPEMAKRHEEAKGIEKAAKDKLDNVASRVDRLQKQRDQIVARQQVHRGQSKEPQTNEGGVALTHAEATRQGELKRATRALKAAKDERKTASAEWKQARRQRVRSNPKRYATGLVDEHGNRISTHEIREHMQANGAREPAFVSHRSDVEGARSFFVNWFGGRKTAGAKGARTGEATRLGAHDATFKALEEHLVRQKGLVDAIDNFDNFAKQFGMKRPDGQLLTWKQAEKAAQDVSEATGVEMVPVRAVPAKLSEEDRKAVADTQNSATSPRYLQSVVERRMTEMLDPPKKGDLGKPTTVLVPKKQLELFKEHQTKSVNDATRSMQALTNLFRSTVLPFSVKWLTGNTVEGLGRLISAGSDLGPDYWRGKKIMSALKSQDEEAWRTIDTQLRGGLLYGSKDRLAVQRSSQDFNSLRARQIGETAHAIRQAPVFKQSLDAIQAYQRVVFAGNKFIEQSFQTAGIGKLARTHARDLNVSWGKALRMQDKAAQEIAKGLLDGPWANRFARELDDMLGKYNGFGPGARHVFQTYAPFLPWFLNAVKFVGYTLPIKRPIQTALIAHANTAFAQEIQQQRNSIPFDDAQNLKAGIPVHGGTIDIARFTPFGVFTQGTGIIADPILPQLSGAANILQGRSFTGANLSQQSGGTVPESKRLWMAAYSLAESVAPGLSIARRAQEHGETAFDDSTVFSPKTKPGTGNSGPAGRILNPVRPSPIGGLGPASAPARVSAPGPAPAKDPIDAAWDRIDAATSQAPDPTDDIWNRVP